MALEKQTVTMPMKFGLDQGTDTAADQSGLRDLINGVFDKDGSVQPRAGFGFKAKVTGTVRGLVASDNAIGVVTTDGITPFVPDVGLGIKNTTSDAEVGDFRYLYNDRNVTFASAARMTVGGVEYTLVASVEADTLTFPLADFTTILYLLAGGNLIQELAIDSDENQREVRVVADTTNHKFYIINRNAGNPNGTGSWSWKSYIPAPDSLTLNAQDTIGTGTVADIASDAVFFGGSVFVSWVSITGSALRVTKITNEVTGSTGALSTTCEVATALLPMPGVGAGFIAVGWFDSTDHVTVSMLTPSSVVFSAAATGAVVPEPLNLSMYVSFGTTQITAVASDQDDFVGHVTTQLFTAAATPSVTAGGVIATTSPAVTAISKATVNGVLIARTLAGTDGYFGGYVLHGGNAFVQVGFAEVILPDFLNAVSDVLTAGNVETYTFPAILAEDGEANAFQHRRRTKLVSLNYAPATVSATKVDGVAFIAASMPRTFDGTVVMTMGNAGQGPQVVSAVETSGSGLEIGTYQYLTYTQLTDTKGHIFAGPPSLPTAGTTSTGNQKMVVSISDLSIPSYSIYDHAELRVYRTDANGSVFHLHHTSRIDPFAFGGGSYDFTDSLSDVDLDTGELLYTSLSGGALPSEAPPPLSFIWSHRNRLFGINAEQPTQVWFTKEMADPVAPQWNAELIKNIENSGGPVIAGGSIGDKCVIFQREQILVFSGQGPDNLGNSALDFSTPESVSKGIGAIDHESILDIPGGIMFRSAAGFYVMTADGGVQFIGKGVLLAERAMGNTRAAAYIPDLHQAWFIGDAADAILVYDVRFNRWSTFAPQTSPAGIISFGGTGWMVDTDGNIWKYDPTTSADEYDPDVWGAGRYQQYQMTIDMPWFRGGGHAGRFRVWRVYITVSGPTLIPLTAYSYTVQAQHNVEHASDNPDATYSIAMPQVADLVEVWFKPVRQRASAFRCRIVVGTNTITSNPVPYVIPQPPVISVKYLYGTEGEDGKSPAGSTAS